jgi:hypothetical protein
MKRFEFEEGIEVNKNGLSTFFFRCKVLDLGRSDNLKTTDEYVLVPRPDFESMDEAQTKINELKTALR